MCDIEYIVCVCDKLIVFLEYATCILINKFSFFNEIIVESFNYIVAVLLMELYWSRETTLVRHIRLLMLYSNIYRLTTPFFDSEDTDVKKRSGIQRYTRLHLHNVFITYII